MDANLWGIWAVFMLMSGVVGSLVHIAWVNGSHRKRSAWSFRHFNLSWSFMLGALFGLESAILFLVLAGFLKMDSMSTTQHSLLVFIGSLLSGWISRIYIRRYCRRHRLTYRDKWFNISFKDWME